MCSFMTEKIDFLRLYSFSKSVSHLSFTALFDQMFFDFKIGLIIN